MIELADPGRVLHDPKTCETCLEREWILENEVEDARDEIFRSGAIVGAVLGSSIGLLVGAILGGAV